MAMTAAVPTGGSDRSPGVDRKRNHDGSSDLNSTQAGSAGEVRKLNEAKNLRFKPAMSCTFYLSSLFLNYFHPEPKQWIPVKLGLSQ